MPLTPGTTLGPYAVTAKIGEAGWARLYRARDTKLDRDVALRSDILAALPTASRQLVVNHPYGGLNPSRIVGWVLR